MEEVVDTIFLYKLIIPVVSLFLYISAYLGIATLLIEEIKLASNGTLKKDTL